MDFNLIGTFLAFLPTILAIALALKTKEVYSSLFVGIVLGAVLYCISVGSGVDGFLTHLMNHTVGEGDDAKSYGLIHCLDDLGLCGYGHRLQLSRRLQPLQPLQPLPLQQLLPPPPR